MNYQFYNDYELIYLIKEESEEALEMLIRKYEPVIRSISSILIKNYSSLKLDYDDMIQEGRIAIIQAIENFKDEKNILFYTFVCTCIKRRLLNLLRTNQNIKNIILNTAIDLDKEEILYQPKDSYEAFSSVCDSEFITNIIKFKNDLDIIDSQIFELKCNNFTYEEISILLEIKNKSIDNRLLKIRKKLKLLDIINI